MLPTVDLKLTLLGKKPNLRRQKPQINHLSCNTASHIGVYIKGCQGQMIYGLPVNLCIVRWRYVALNLEQI